MKRVLSIAALVFSHAGCVLAQPISALPPASTPLSGSELIPIVQGGISKRTTSQDIANKASSQNANQNTVLAGPVTGGSGAASFRNLGGADIPAINLASSANGGATGILPVSKGGTNSITASGSALDNIAGFSGTGLMQRTGAGSYSFLNSSQAYSFLPASCKNILAYGGDATGTNDNVTAFNNAVAANASTAAVCVYMPTGKYKFASAPTISLPSGSTVASVNIIGDGADATILLPGTDVNGLVLNLQAVQHSFHIRNLSILAANASTVSTGIKVTQTNAANPNPAISEISGVTVRGADGYGSVFKFATGVDLNATSNVNITNSAIFGAANGQPYALAGTCVYVHGTSTAIPVQINFVSDEINYCQYGLNYGNYVQGVAITSTNFVGTGTAVYQPAGQVGNDQLSITTSQFNSGTADVSLNSIMDGITISSSVFYLGPAGTAAIKTLGNQYSIVGNAFIGTSASSGTGIEIDTYTVDFGSIVGNSFNLFANGIYLTSGSNALRTAGNNFANTTNAYLVSSSAGQFDLRDSVSASITGVTNLGTGGTGTLQNGSSSVAGVIQLATGTGATSSGTVTLTFPFNAPNVWNCVATLNNGSIAWAPTAQVNSQFSSAQSSFINWTNAGAALTASSTYRINYHCQAL